MAFMKRLRSRQLKVLFVLSVALPVGLLATFKLVGVLRQFTISDIRTLEEVKWEMDRPLSSLNLWDKIESIFNDSYITVNLTSCILMYRWQSTLPPFDGRDGLEFAISLDATVKQGPALIVLRLQPAEPYSMVFAHEGYAETSNITIESWREHGTADTEANMTMRTSDTPCSLRYCPGWILDDRNVQNHTLNIVAEVTYRADSEFKKVNIPVTLHMFPDVGNTFEEASIASFGLHRGCIDNVDSKDLYKIWLYAGQALNITMTPPQDAYFETDFYQPNGAFFEGFNTTAGQTVFALFPVQETGFQYIKVRQNEWVGHANDGMYILNLSMVE
jgi:hypothetical protein